MSEAEIVAQLETSHGASVSRSALGEDLDTLKEWAVHAGWEPTEVDRAFLTLSEVYYARMRAAEDE